MIITRNVRKTITIDSPEEVVKCDECECEATLEDQYSFLPPGWATIQFSTWDGCRNYKNICPACLVARFTDIIL